MSISPDSSTPPTWQRARDVAQRLVAILALLGGIVFLLNLDHFLGGHANIPTMAGENLSYALLFVAGLFTGFHCVGMCGALVVGYTVKAAAQDGSKYFTHLYYGAGKTLSYTLVGAGFGALGAIITFTPFMRGLAGIGAGIFLLLFGLATLNLFPSLARFRIKTPAFVMRHLGKAYRSNSNPFVIGLLNGLMIICGPLQAMYIMAAGTGDPIEGGKLLFVFGLGTLPVMLGFGLLTSALSKQFAPKIVKASGVIVIGLGAIMLNRGLAMVGSGYDYHSLLARWQAGSAVQAPPVGDSQDIQMMVQGEQYAPNQFVLRQGVPVRWTIHGQELTACNKRIVVPSLGMEFEVQPGHNQIQFTPKQAGVIPWSCSMGLIHGTFLVQEAAPTVQTIRMTANRDGYTPHQFTLRQDVPVRWIIAGEALGYCNHRLTVPALNLEFDLHPGENIIEFTPTQTGMIPWSCWMGDSQGVFLVHENTEPLAEPTIAMNHDHDHAHHGDSPPPRWMQDLLERSAEAVDLLRDKLRP